MVLVSIDGAGATLCERSWICSKKEKKNWWQTYHFFSVFHREALVRDNWTGVEPPGIIRHSLHGTSRKGISGFFSPQDLPVFIIQTTFIPTHKLSMKIYQTCPLGNQVNGILSRSSSWIETCAFFPHENRGCEWSRGRCHALHDIPSVHTVSTAFTVGAILNHLAEVVQEMSIL